MRGKRNRLNGADSRERVGAIFREHGDDHVNNVSQLSLVSGCNINENVLGLNRDLSPVGVDLRSQSFRRLPKYSRISKLDSQWEAY